MNSWTTSKHFRNVSPVDILLKSYSLLGERGNGRGNPRNSSLEKNVINGGNFAF